MGDWRWFGGCCLFVMLVEIGFGLDWIDLGWDDEGVLRGGLVDLCG